MTGTGEPPEPPVKTDNVDQRFRGATPITIFTEFDCSPVGLIDAGRVASDALARAESRQLEFSFWTGLVGSQEIAFPHLAADAEVQDSNDITLQTAASICVTGADIAHGLGELEQCLADCYAGQGIIHIPRVALSSFAAWNLASEREGRLYTPSGNLIVVGDGYTGSSPDGTDPISGTSWIYATGAMIGYRGDVFMTRVRDSLDRAENTLRMIAERTYVLAFECCHLAALVDLGVPTA